MSTFLRKLKPFGFYVLAWTLVGVIYFGQNVTRRFYWDDPNPWQDIRYWSANIYISALLTPLIIWAGRSWPLERNNLARIIPLHVVLSVAWAVSRLVLEWAFHLTWNQFSPIDPPITPRSELSLLFIFGFHTAIVAYWVVFSIQTAFRNYARFQEREQAALRADLRSSQLETQVAQARLGALKAQLQPHFLFNTLNAIVVLVRQQKGQQAEETLARFSDLLRAVLADMELQEVTLARELEYLKLYLSIEQLRFSDRLRVEFDVDPELLDAAVPHMAHMALQPIVENAIRHGVGRRASLGVIRISARRVAGALQVTVRDDGPGFGAVPGPAGLGLGLSNTRARLSHHYGANYRFEFHKRVGAFAVVIVLPWRADAPERAPRVA